MKKTIAVLIMVATQFGCASKRHVVHDSYGLNGFACRHYQTDFPLAEQGQTIGCNDAKSNALCSRLTAIPGIENVYVERYEVTIFKAELFKWEPIENRVEAAIKASHI